MRRLFRSLLALVALGTTVFGCNKSNTSHDGSGTASSWVTMSVPGMT
jgi:hypothetical protein